MRRIKKLGALLLASAVLVCSIPAEFAFATTMEEPVEETFVEDQSEIVETIETMEAADGSEVVENIDEALGVVESNPVSMATVQYVVVEKPYVSSGEQQNIVVGIAEGTASSATLKYHKTSDGAELRADASAIIDGALKFTMVYSTASSTGEYIVDGVSYVADGKAYELDFDTAGIDAKYGVNIKVDTDADDYIVEDSSDEVMTIDNMVASMTISGQTNTTKNGGWFVIVLDPGHGKNDSGATANGVLEKNLNLKIAQYCKEELDQYKNVYVAMTRDDDTFVSLSGRSEIASEYNCDVFISFHNNSASGSAHGAEVYYPNAGLYPELNTIGKNLAQSILNQLVALGLYNRGVHIRNSETGDTYADGSSADYYSVIRGCKKAGIPGLIVEHAFVSNSSDVANFLNDDAKLKKLGVADATGIANYYGLVKGADTLKPFVIQKKNGLVDINSTTMGYYKNNVLQSGFTGFVADSTGKEWLVKNGYVYKTSSDIVYTSYKGQLGWWCITNGTLNTSETVAHNQNGWFYCNNGKVDFNYDGLATNQNGTWYCQGGKVNFNVDGVIYTKKNGTYGWWNVVGSKLTPGPTVAHNQNGWWYIDEQGKVDFNANTVAHNANGWWGVTGGKVTFSFNGFLTNQNGTWYCQDSRVDFSVTSVVNGFVNGEEGWWNVVDNKLTPGPTVAHNQNGWWYIDEKGKVDFKYNGFAKNHNGWWYLSGGKVDFNKNGTFNGTVNGVTKDWKVVGGKVIL